MGAFLIGIATIVVVPILVTAVWELWLRGAILPYVLRFRYQIRRRLTRERPLSEVVGRLRAFCGPNDVTKRVMQALDTGSLAIDGCFELLHSHGYKGWTAEDIEFQPFAGAVPLPNDLRELTERFRPSPPSHTSIGSTAWSPTPLSVQSCRSSSLSRTTSKPFPFSAACSSLSSLRAVRP